MLIHPTVTQVNGVVTVALTASFIGSDNDVTDKQRIQAYGDPKINLAGLMTDPSDTEFQFSFPATELYAGLTTSMQNTPARFMVSVPPITPGMFPGLPGWPNQCGAPALPGQGRLDCLTPDPVHAATVYAATIQTRCAAAMSTLRALTPPQLSSLSDSTI